MGKNRRTVFKKFYDENDDFYGGYGSQEEAMLGYMSPSPYSRSAPAHHSEIMPSGMAAVTLRGDHKPLKRRNKNQERYVQLLQDTNHPIVIATGSAGSGKTLIANSYGIEEFLKGTYRRLVITRPIVGSDEEAIGYLPGTMKEKTLPWLMPIYDVYRRYMTQAQIDNLLAKDQLEIVPLSMMRGRSFDDRTYIVADECQNMTPSQCLLLLTRIGDGSKLVMTGDPLQSDKLYGTNGLTDLLHRLGRSPVQGIGLVEFTEADVVRHPIIRRVLRLYHKEARPARPATAPASALAQEAPDAEDAAETTTEDAQETTYDGTLP